jgi:uncharacterized protein YkwD
MAGAALAAALLSSPAAAAATEAEQAYADAINVVREAHGLDPLAEDATLARTADRHSADMVANQYFAHGEGWVQRLVRAGAHGPQVGENLGWCAARSCLAGSPRRVIQAWLASPLHRRNMLDPRFRHIGVGIAVGPFRGWPTAVVVTTDFDG